MKKLSYRQRFIPYLIGYTTSLVFTLNAYLAVVQRQDAIDTDLVILLIALAIGQFIVQLVFFLHLGREPKPRWNSMAFITMIMVVLFIVGGSIWVMNNLNYNMMGDHAAREIIQDEGIEP